MSFELKELGRSKRYLLFPRANPTRHQFVAGVGIPLELPQSSVISGYVIRGNYFLPYKVQQFVPMFLKNETILADEIWTRLNRTDFLRRKRDENTLENDNEENLARVLEEDEMLKWQELNNEPYNSRWTLYEMIMGAIDK